MAALSYSLTFAGIPVITDDGKQFLSLIEGYTNAYPASKIEGTLAAMQRPLADVIDEVNRLIPFLYINDFKLPNYYLGHDLSALSNKDIGPHPNPYLLIGDWYYPTTMSRWSAMRVLATSSMVKQLLVATNGGSTASLLSIVGVPISPRATSTPTSAWTVNTLMRMLPPRPLGEHAGGLDGLFLVTLVDDRYYNTSIPVSLRVTSTTQWTDLITALSLAMEVTISYSSIPIAYSQPEPDSQLWCNVESAATLLDAVAYNLGRVVVRNLDGTYTLQTFQEAQVQIALNRGSLNLVERLAGGDMFSSGGNLPAGPLLAARNSVAPSAIVIGYPKYVKGDDPVPHFLDPRYCGQRPSSWYETGLGSRYSITVPIASGGIAVSGLAGTSTALMRDTAKALGDSEGTGTPLNISGLTSLAMQTAQDVWGWQVIASLDEVYPGILAWAPEGAHDIIWSWSAKRGICSTRVIRGDWNHDVTELQHAGPPVSGGTIAPRGHGGHSVALSVWDTFSGAIPSMSISATGLTSGGMQVTLGSGQVGYIPTNYRWRGKIDDEVILFEGASNGVIIDIAWRGIDGTQQVAHGAGASIFPLSDYQHGVNSLRAGEGSFIAPDVLTSGGVQGAALVPQFQTVQTIDSGIPAGGGVRVFYNPVTNSQVNRESVRIIERNTRPFLGSKRYAGQFIGYGGIGSPPQYLIDEPLGSGAITSGMIASGAINITLNLINITTTNITLVSGANNYSVSGVSKALIATGLSGGASINGFGGGAPYQVLYVWNVGSTPVVLQNQKAFGGALLCPLQSDYTLWPLDGVTLEYDASSGSASGVWRFDNPTIGTALQSGSNLTPAPQVYATRQINFSSGLSMVDNQDGSVNVYILSGKADALPCDSWYSGVFTVLVSGVFDSGTCTLTLQSKTITVNCGKIVSVV